MENSSCYPTWTKTAVFRAYIERMRVREKRRVFNIMRMPGMTADTFLPAHGFTLGEFSCFQVLSDSTRRSGRR